MGALVYSVIASLDGYVADTDGGFDWAAPDAEVHAFVNERMRTAGSHLLGRRSFEVMHWWEGPGPEVEPAVEREFRQVWQDADKVVFSTTLADVTAPRARLVRSFDAEAVRRIKAGAPRDLTVGGRGLAAAALRAGLVDSVELFLVPVVVGGGRARCRTACAWGWGWSSRGRSVAGPCGCGTTCAGEQPGRGS